MMQPLKVYLFAFLAAGAIFQLASPIIIKLGSMGQSYQRPYYRPPQPYYPSYQPVMYLRKPPTTTTTTTTAAPATTTTEEPVVQNVHIFFPPPPKHHHHRHHHHKKYYYYTSTTTDSYGSWGWRRK